MKKKLLYHIFYWHPNTISEEKVAVGLCVYDSDFNWLDSHWIAQKELNRLHNIFSFSSPQDAKFVLQLLSDIKVSWKELAFKSNFWEYVNRYWNGIIQVSEKKTMLFDGTKEGFQKCSSLIQQKFLPLAKTDKKINKGFQQRGIQRIYEREVNKVKLSDKVVLRYTFPSDDRYHLLKQITVDLAARNGEPIISTGFDMSLKTGTLTDKALAYFDGFQRIKKQDGGMFSIVLHEHGQPFDSKNISSINFYDNFMFTCENLEINTMGVNELPEYLEELTEVKELKPLDS